jgi:hypothetical protein
MSRGKKDFDFYISFAVKAGSSIKSPTGDLQGQPQGFP